MNQWRKVAKQAFLAALSTLSREQRVAIIQIVDQLERNPTTVKAITYPNGDKEAEVSGVWLRYRIEAKAGEIIFLTVTK